MERTGKREISRAGETWEATLNGEREAFGGVQMILKPGYGTRQKIATCPQGVFTLPSADFIDLNQVSAPVCWYLV